MLIPVGASPSPFARELDVALVRRRHGQDDQSNEGPGGNSHDGGGSPDDNEVVASATLTDPNASDGPVATPTSSVPAPTASSNGSSEAPALRFIDVQNATTCQSYTFSWSSDSLNPSSNIKLFIGGSLGPDSNTTATLSSSDNLPPPIRILSTRIPLSATNFTWVSVDLTEGWYTLDAQPSRAHRSVKFTSQPAPLYVINGTDTSCVRSSQPISSSHPRLSTGDIVAVVIGAVAAAGLLAVAFAFPRLWRRDLPSPKRPRPYYLY